jgi:hypothetical protein
MPLIKESKFDDFVSLKMDAFRGQFFCWIKAEIKGAVPPF